MYDDIRSIAVVVVLIAQAITVDADIGVGTPSRSPGW